MNDKKDGAGKVRVSMAMPDNSVDYQEKTPTKTIKLKIDKKSYKPAKTMLQLYNELKQSEEILDKDVYDYASYFSRGAALALDLAFIFFLYKIVVFISPYEFKLVQYFLNSYKIKFFLGDKFLLQMIIALTAVVAIFFGVIIPVAFYNSSFGKKILKLRVRGLERYNISIDEAIFRELFIKPVSIVLIIGLIFPFIDKEKKTLHDKIMKTMVIKD